MNERLNQQMIDEFAKSVKIGLVATIDETDGPHVTVLSTLMGKGEDRMMLGKFVEGLSKEFILVRPKTGFLIMNPQKKFWFGTMDYREAKTEGDDYVAYNNQPLYRYNSYFGINTVYYFKLNGISDENVLPMGTIVKNAIRVLLAKRRFADKTRPAVMKPWAEGFIEKLDTLKFLSYVGQDGYPRIVPVIQAQSAGSARILLRNEPYGELLSDVTKGMKVAILAFSMTMETVLVKGTFQGFDGKGFGVLDIERVYNSMPPVHGYVYPPQPKQEVKFDRS